MAVVPAVPCRPSRPLPPPPAARHWPAGGSAPLPAAAAAALPSAPPAPLPRPARSSRLGQERPRSESREPHVKKESTAKIHLQHILHHAGSSYVAWWTRPRLVPGISIRDHGWNSGKQANETCRRTGFHTKSPLSPVRRSRPLPSWGVSEQQRAGPSAVPQKSPAPTHLLNALLDEPEQGTGAPDIPLCLQQHRVCLFQILNHLFHIALHSICPVPGETKKAESGHG